MIYSFDTKRFRRFGLAVLAIALLASQAGAPTNSGITAAAGSQIPVASRKNAATAPAAVPTRLAGAKAGGFGLILGVGY
jgi:hypothetical protein